MKTWCAKKARLLTGSRALLFLLFCSGSLRAACPPDANPSLRVRNPGSQDVPITQTDAAFDQGPVSVVLPLNLPLGDANLLPSGTIPTSITIPVSRWLWRFRVRNNVSNPPAYWPLDRNELLIDYDVNGSGQASGIFTSTQNPASQVTVTVSTRRIRQRNRPNRRIFRGWVDLLVDYSQATVAGTYKGTITVTVDCP